MSKDSILFRVANVSDPLHTTVAEAKLLLQNSDNFSQRYLRSSVFARFKLDLLCVPDTLPSLACRMNRTDDTCLFCFLSQFRLSLPQEKTLTLLQVLEQIVNSLHLHIEKSRNFTTRSRIRCHKLYNLHARTRVEFTEALSFARRVTRVVSWLEVCYTSFKFHSLILEIPSSFLLAHFVNFLCVRVVHFFHSLTNLTPNGTHTLCIVEQGLIIELIVAHQQLLNLVIPGVWVKQ